ncbi:hypothetical protein TNCV_2423201 [Trichonephila clavipes]|nr:hypothetical protein TNCV_2423201 [Trichonephila clavipes]
MRLCVLSLRPPRALFDREEDPFLASSSEVDDSSDALPLKLPYPQMGGLRASTDLTCFIPTRKMEDSVMWEFGQRNTCLSNSHITDHDSEFQVDNSPLFAARR